MIYASSYLTNDQLAPSIVSLESASTPVWMQQRWNSGDFSFYIRRNGCGHCCTAMAACLHGIDINPHQEYELCRSLWGVPHELPDEKGQDHFQSTAGIVKILHHLNIPASGHGVKDIGPHKATQQICAALQAGKQVIFASNPDDFPDNPFSTGYHWVLAVGYVEDGRILVANSSEKATSTGVQLVSPELIERALFRNATYSTDLTWGELERLQEGCGYIILG